jgi:hypothetical protein
MAFQAVVTKTNQLEKQRLGYIGLTVDEWDTNNEPEITAGSKIEISGTLYEITALEDIDPDGNWAGIGNSTVVYGYLDPNNLKSVLSITAPTWNDAKQGYYDATNTFRYYLKIYKDAGGNYTQKSIYINQHYMKINNGIALNTEADGDKLLRFNTDASILYDNSDSEFYTEKAFKIDGGIETDGLKYKTKEFTHSIWDCDAVGTTYFDHGLTSTNIKRISAMVKAAGQNSYILDADGVGLIRIQSTRILLTRTIGGDLDAAIYSTATATILIDYEV